MTTWVCFLRGINVGGHRKVPMADLRQLLQDIIGDTDAQTYIASGNAVFTAVESKSQLKTRLRTAIEERFGFVVDVLLLSAQEMRDVLTSCPCPAEKGNLAHAYLCFDVPKLNKSASDALIAPSETLTVAERTIWLHAPEGIGRSKLAAKLEKLIGVAATARNLNTIRKMVEMTGA